MVTAGASTYAWQCQGMAKAYYNGGLATVAMQQAMK